MSDAREAQALLSEALSREGEAQRLLLAGNPGADGAMREVAVLYRRSWEAAPPRSYGRLVGMLKASVLSGDAALARDSASYARGQIEGEGDSPASCYAVALAALIDGDAPVAARAAEGMRSGSEAFERTSEAIEALALGEGDRFRRALEEIFADFASRDEHLTGVPIADTALVLERVSALG
jgi:hypothetical protein